MNKTVIMMIGVPGSGKSTYAKNIQHSYKNPVILSTDSIREELYGDENIQGDSSQVFSTFYGRFQEYALDLETDCIIVDATFNNTWSRKELIRRMPSNCELHGVFMNTPLDVSIERNNARNRVVPEDVIRRMHRNLEKEPPLLVEGFTRINVYYGEKEGEL